MSKQTVVVGMSGGVDSSVSALLLKQQGYHVIGLFMKNWEDQSDTGLCQSTVDFHDVRQVCQSIDIPYYPVNFVNEYRDTVFNDFIEDFKLGLTPNPDILCNQEIKFKLFLNKAIELGADFLATGHYCQKDKEHNLMKGADPGKDQSYFLYTLNREVLSKVLFPIGSLLKSEVRAIAKQHHLATSDKKDSTGICFIGKRNFREFLSQYISVKPGDFKTLSGKIVGRHHGAAYYTIGQRKGLGIGGPGEAWFVVGKEVDSNVVYVEQGADHPSLFYDALKAHKLSWVGTAPDKFPFHCCSKIRYRQSDHPCIIESIENGQARVIFPEPQRAVTLGQSIVFYSGHQCLGGGVICEAVHALTH